MAATRSDSLSVVGAKLYYEVRGTGPVLLLIAAGAGDADSYGRMYEYLTPHFTVVTYDRRGFARSPLDNPDQIVGVGNHSDDAHRLLSLFGTEPMYVFGCSIGAMIGLDLTIHHPEQVRTFVSHEAPVMSLLPEAEQEQFRRDQEKIQETLRREGATSAIKQFAANVGVNRDDQNMGLPQTNAASAQHNREAFFKYDAGAVARYQFDLQAVQAVKRHIIVGGGVAGKDSFPYHCAVALADALGTRLINFPGTHAGFVDYPKEFAEQLINVLKQN